MGSNPILGANTTFFSSIDFIMTFYDIHHVTFGKDQDARKEGKKGNAVKSDLRNWQMSLAFRELWKIQYTGIII